MKKLFCIALTIALVLSLAACGGASEPTAAPEATAAPETTAAPAETSGDEATLVVDRVGREVPVNPGSYRRVVCIGAGALRLYSYIGDMSLLAGVEDIDNITLEGRPAMFDSVSRPYFQAHQELLTSLPSCGVGGPMAQTAEAEKILACEPDIVISAFEDAQKEDALQEQLGVPVITLSVGPNGVFDPEFAENLKLLGAIFGREDRARELIDFVEDQTEDIRQRTAPYAGSGDTPAVYICGLGNWGTTNHLMTAQVYAPFTVANIRNVLTDLDAQGVQPIEAEKFVELGESMDVMILDAAAIKNIAPLYQEDPTLFDTCKAWQTGEVYLEMAYNAYYTNFEIALCNTWFAAKAVYPEAFQDIDMTEKTNEITAMFLGRPMAEEIFACPGSFGGYQKIDTESFFN